MKRKTRTLALLALMLAGCRAPRVVTSPRSTGCPAGYAWVYHEQEANRDVCVRRDSE